MRVLHLDSGRSMRGGQWQALRLVEGLRARGVECTFLTRCAMPAAEPLSLTRLPHLARRHDLVHAHDSRSHTLAALLCGRTPLVVARRVAFSPHPGWKYRRAACFIAVSEHVRSVLAAAGVPEGKIAVAPDGVPVLAPACAADYLLAPANQDDPMKGAALAAEAARLAGAELRFSGDLETDLARAAAFLYITQSEGLGSAVLLAMSAGVPVIASRVGGIPEVVRDGENGLLVENAAPDIAQAIERLARDPALARRLGEAGRATVLARFTVDDVVDRTLGIYRQVLSSWKS